MELKNIRTTLEYFGMNREQLAEIRNEYGYTREDNKIFDEGLKVHFFEHFDSINDEEFKSYLKSSDMELKVILKTIDDRFAVILF